MERMKLYDYLEWWKDRSGNEVELKYLKDWHCRHFLQEKPVCSISLLSKFCFIVLQDPYIFQR